MKIHQHSSEFFWTPPMVFVPLPRVHEVFGEPVPVLNVVPASAPDPVTCHVLGATRLAAPTLTELPLPARATDRVYDPSRRHRVSKSGFPACWGKKGRCVNCFKRQIDYANTYTWSINWKGDFFCECTWVKLCKHTPIKGSYIHVCKNTSL